MTAAEVDRLVVTLEAAFRRVQAAQGSLVRLPSAELDLLVALEHIRNAMQAVLKAGDREQLKAIFGGACTRTARIRAVLDSVQLTPMHAKDRRLLSCLGACVSVEQVLHDLGFGSALQSAQERQKEVLARQAEEVARSSESAAAAAGSAGASEAELDFSFAPGAAVRATGTIHAAGPLTVGSVEASAASAASGACPAAEPFGVGVVGHEEACEAAIGSRSGKAAGGGAEASIDFEVCFGAAGGRPAGSSAAEGHEAPSAAGELGVAGSELPRPAPSPVDEAAVAAAHAASAALAPSPSAPSSASGPRLVAEGTIATVTGILLPGIPDYQDGAVGRPSTAGAARPLCHRQGKVPLCRVGCGRRVAPGVTRHGKPFDTCCRACATGHGHGKLCGMIDSAKVGPGFCKLGCGLPAAKGRDSSGQAIDTCCRGCARGEGHDEFCGKDVGDKVVPYLAISEGPFFRMARRELGLVKYNELLEAIRLLNKRQEPVQRCLERTRDLVGPDGGHIYDTLEVLLLQSDAAREY